MSVFKGRVIRGSGTGKRLGLPPTINFELSTLPRGELAHGIYRVRVAIGAEKFDGVAHYGLRPAVSEGESFEIHCFGLNRDTYGESVAVEVFEKIREAKNFKTIGELKGAIEEDIRIAKSKL